MDLLKHHLVYNFLKNKIIQGEYAPGTMLPSENDLCQLFGVTRPTVRQSLARLEFEKYIYRQHGKGSIVSETKKALGILSIKSTTLGIYEGDLKTHMVVRPHIIAWPEPFVFPLSDEDRKDFCYYLERKRIVDSKEVLYEITYIPNKELDGFQKIDMENQSLFKILADVYAIEITGGEQKLRAIIPDKKIQGYLNVGKETPILKMERKIQTNKNHFNIYSILYCNTEAFYLDGRF